MEPCACAQRAHLRGLRQLDLHALDHGPQDGQLLGPLLLCGVIAAPRLAPAILSLSPACHAPALLPPAPRPLSRGSSSSSSPAGRVSGSGRACLHAALVRALLQALHQPLLRGELVRLLPQLLRLLLDLPGSREYAGASERLRGSGSSGRAS